MDIDMALPLDNGFLRRQCPYCNREFKWHSGPTAERPDNAVDPTLYYCPYCGEAAEPDQWWTEAQLAHAQDLISGETARLLNNEMQRMARRHRSGSVKFSVSSNPIPNSPSPLVEPSDMVALTSPCHPWEPIKILEEWTNPLHCLICGRGFALS